MRACATDDCSLPSTARGLCKRCYQRGYLAGQFSDGAGRSRAPEPWERELSEHSDYTYAMRAPWVPEGIIKIGVTSDPLHRLAGYRATLPGAQFLRVVGIPDVDRKLVERALRAALHPDLAHGHEWFRIDLDRFDAVLNAVLRNLPALLLPPVVEDLRRRGMHPNTRDALEGLREQRLLDRSSDF